MFGMTLGEEGRTKPFFLSAFMAALSLSVSLQAILVVMAKGVCQLWQKEFGLRAQSLSCVHASVFCLHRASSALFSTVDRVAVRLQVSA